MTTKLHCIKLEMQKFFRFWGNVCYNIEMRVVAEIFLSHFTRFLFLYFITSSPLHFKIVKIQNDW